MTKIEFSCTECGTKIRTAAANAGKRGKCKSCSAVQAIPFFSEAASSTLAADDDPLANLPPEPEKDFWSDLPSEPSSQELLPDIGSSPFAGPLASPAVPSYGAQASYGAPASYGPASYGPPAYSPPAYAGGYGPADAAGKSGGSASVPWGGGKVMAVALGLLILFLPCPFGIVAAAALDGSPAAGGAILLLVFCGLMGAAIVMGMGYWMSNTTVTLEPLEMGRANCTIVRHFAMIPVYRSVVGVTTQDCLVKEVQDSQMTTGHVDLIFLLIVIGLLLIGFCPGILFFFFWHSARQNVERSKVTLWVDSRWQGKRVKLYSKTVQNYHGTAYGDPSELVTLMRYFEQNFPLHIIAPSTL